MKMLRKIHAAVLILVTLQALTVVSGAQKLPARSLPSSQRALEKQGLSRPLWPGSRWTEAMRARAVRRGLQFIYRTALVDKNFKEYGSDYLWCFYTLSVALKDPEMRRMARRMGLERARRWRRLHPTLPAGADAGIIADYAFGSDAADSLGLRDEKLKAEIRSRAPRFNASAYMRFDPATEPPPDDVPEECSFCHANNLRGASLCNNCKRPLKMRTRQDVWYDALITAYSGERYGVILGAKYGDVLKWLPTLRPYPRDNQKSDEFYDTVYAITHVVYTLNDYSQYRLNPRLLPHEFEFLRETMTSAISQRDADMLGEFMDSLRAFGMKTGDPLMRKGMEYLLETQNSDGSWGNRRERDIYLRYHPTWNAVAALSEYDWQREGLSHPELKSMLEEWAGERQVK